MRLVTFLIFLVAACGANQHSGTKYPADPPPREIVLGVGDVVEINVWEQKDLASETVVRPDGTITMPLVGDLKAAGETPTTLKNRIKTQLQAYVKMQGTEVTVAVKSWRSYRFTIQGEVSKAGVFSSDQFLTVSDALALAGGLTEYADRGRLVIIRKAGNTTRFIPFAYDKVTPSYGTKGQENLYLQPDDIIMVR